MHDKTIPSHKEHPQNHATPENNLYTVDDVAAFAEFFTQAYEVENGVLTFRLSDNATRISNLTTKEIFNFWYQNIKND